MFKKIFNKAKNAIDKIKVGATGLMISIMALPVYADTKVEELKPAADIDPLAMIGKIAGLVLTIVQGIGLVFVVWGGFQLAMAFRDDDGASKQRAIQTLVAGVVALGIGTVLKLIGVLA